MFYEYAVLPDVFESTAVDDRVLFTVLDQLLAGILENGMIANLNKDKLIRYVRDRALPAVLTPNARAQIMDRLVLLENRHRLVRHPATAGTSPECVDDWLSLALQSHARIRFDALFLCKELLQRWGLTDPAVVELSTALASVPWMTRRRSAPVQMIDSEFRRVLAPILRHARSVSLVDQYLSPTNPRYWTTVSLVSELTGVRGHGQQLSARIHIHAGDPAKGPAQFSQSPSDRLDLWEQKLAGLNAYLGTTHVYKIFLWGPKQIGGRDLHDRYVLTDQVAIATPGGLDCQPIAWAHESMWSVLDEQDRRRLLEEYDAQLSPFKLLASRDVAP